jgi:hypothetical protein
MLLEPTLARAVVWTSVEPDTWSASWANGTSLGSITRTDHYDVHSADHIITGTHSSLESARSQIEAHSRWLRAHSVDGS